MPRFDEHTPCERFLVGVGVIFFVEQVLHISDHSETIAFRTDAQIEEIVTRHVPGKAGKDQRPGIRIDGVPINPFEAHIAAPVVAVIESILGIGADRPLG